MTAGGGDGTLFFDVWPPYIAFATSETEQVPPQRRAQILWHQHNGSDLVGSAQVWVPEGEYPVIAFFHSPDGPMTRFKRFEHPFRQPIAGFVTVDPLTNAALAQR